MKFNFEVNNEIFGTIKGEEIKSIILSLIKSERQFEMEIMEFYESNNKVLLIHLDEDDYSQHAKLNSPNNELIYSLNNILATINKSISSGFVPVSLINFLQALRPK